MKIEKTGAKNMEKWIQRILTAFFLVAFMILAENGGYLHSLNGLGKITNGRYLFLFAAAFAIVIVFCEGLRIIGEIGAEPVLLAVAAFGYGFLAACQTADIYELTVLAFFVLLVIGYSLRRMPPLRISGKGMKAGLLFLLVATLCYVGSLVVLRVVLFRTVTFDFGIFVQMFYYLKHTGIPYTTCERFQLLSHFTIHFSPFFYLLLPIYALFPSDITLVILQLLAVFSGAVPLYLLCRRKIKNPLVILVVVSAYLLYPTFRGGLFYDFHENKFLAPVILWLFYFWEEEKNRKKKWIGVSISFVLLLTIKEDAAIYAACIGLYWLFAAKKKEDKTAGGVLFLLSTLYFFVVFHFMQKYGDAGSAITSFGRYENLTESGYTGITALLTNILKDPAYVCTQLLDAEKLEFLLWMFLPVLFLPLKTKRYEEFILLLPLLLFNLLSDYPYQHNIYYQYAYGSGALLLYLVYKNACRQAGNSRTAVLMLTASLLFSAGCLNEKNGYYQEYQTEKTALEETRKLLQEIPENASVSATTTYVPPLAGREEIYKHQKGDDMDYIVLSLKSGQRDENLAEAEEYEENGYLEVGRVENMVIVLKKIK